VSAAESRVAAVRVVMGPEEQAAVQDVLRSGRLVQGEQVEAFEREFAALVGGRECVAVNSGTSALHLGLIAAGIGPGDEVIVPSFTFAATANAVVRAGATPVFVDIDPGSFCIDPRSVERAITRATRAVIPVHLYGQPADMSTLSALTSDRSITLFEDACQAHAAALNGNAVGALGDLAAFSFYATKNMTTGEGGMVVCDDAGIARRIRLLRNQGMETKYRNEVAGLNNRMPEVAAAIGRVQLGRLAGWNTERRAAAGRYDAELHGVITPAVSPGVIHAYHQYTVRSTERDRVASELDARGIDTAVYYPVPTHRLPAYRSQVELPETEKAAAEVLSLPIRPGLTKAELDRVVDAVNEITGDHRG
jgi:perosamine synthetase